VGVRFHPGAGCNALGCLRGSYSNQSVPLAASCLTWRTKFSEPKLEWKVRVSGAGFWKEPWQVMRKNKTADDRVQAAVKLIARRGG